MAEFTDSAHIAIASCVISVSGLCKEKVSDIVLVNCCAWGNWCVFSSTNQLFTPERVYISAINLFTGPRVVLLAWRISVIASFFFYFYIIYIIFINILSPSLLFSHSS